MPDNRDLQLIRRKVRDRSGALVLVGTVLLMPPIGGLARIDGTIFGIPIPLAYMFGVWAVLIIGAFLLSRPLRDTDKPPPSTSVALDIDE